MHILMKIKMSTTETMEVASSDALEGGKADLALAARPCDVLTSDIESLHPVTDNISTEQCVREFSPHHWSRSSRLLA